MWQSSDGRGTVFPWSDARAVEAPRFSVGDVVRAEPYDTRGTVVSVDVETCTMGVKWDDGDGPITYPLDATFLTKQEKMPWQ